MQVEIKRLDIVSVVKVCFVLYAVIGVIAGLVYAIVALVLGSFLDHSQVFEGSRLMPLAATGLGILMIPLLALIYGCLGALGGLIFAVVYNLISRAVGGVKVSLWGEVAGPGSSVQPNEQEVRL